MFISIDVGIKNLAYVVYDKDIVDWKVLELCDKTQNASKLNMIEVGKKLYELLETLHHPITEVIIENQIGQNAIRMKMLQGMITFYFISKGITNIHYWNAGNKLKRYIKVKTTYSQRKKYSVQITRDIVTQSFLYRRNISRHIRRRTIWRTVCYSCLIFREAEKASRIY